jgi:hypothetical protein
VVVVVYAENVYVAVARITLQVIGLVLKAIRGIGPEEVVEAFYVVEVMKGETPKLLVFLRRAMSFSPPEPAAGVLVEWSEDDRYLSLDDEPFCPRLVAHSMCPPEATKEPVRRLILCVSSETGTGVPSPVSGFTTLQP